MKISVTPISFSAEIRTGRMDLAGFIKTCAEMEVDGVDILDSACYPWLWKDKDNEMKNLSRMLADNNLELAAYATGNNFAKTDKAEHNKNVEIVKTALREAGELGAKNLRIFGGYHKESGGDAEIDYDNGLELIINGIESCISEAEKCGVCLALENHGRLPGHSYEIESIMKHFNSKWVRTMFDCGNFMGNGMDEQEDPLRAYERLKKYVVHVHVKDMGSCISNNLRKIEGYVCGKGNVPLRQFAALLEENNYQGFCSLEHEAAAILPNTEGVPQAIAYLKRIRAIHQMFESKNG
ncbi:MAG: sugar phosphate isomerase/epimerase family protein [Planctomycetota bacterium]|jgi:sugar phosphate isomerase/epimerase